MVDNNEIEISKKLKEKQLEIWEELNRVCGLLNITCCFAFGSSLGAKRHQGFIPWDDDIDVYMRIEDLEKLQANAHLFQDKYFLQHHGSDPEYGLLIARLRDSQTTLIEKNEEHRNINHGIFIDIYPLFNCPKKGFKATMLVAVSRVYRLMLYGFVPQKRGKLMKYGSLILLKIVPVNMQKYLQKNCYRILRKTKETGFLTGFHANLDNVRFPNEWIYPVKWVPFENIIVPVQANQEKYLTLVYGDYMKLPPEEKRVFHHDYTLIDFDESYVKYKGKYYCKENT